MKRLNFLFYLLLLLGLVAPINQVSSTPASLAAACDLRCEVGGSYAPQLLKKILEAAIAEWPYPCNYGSMRSAYNHGNLTIEGTTHPSNIPAYFVKFDGITVCVLIPA